MKSLINQLDSSVSSMDTLNHMRKHSFGCFLNSGPTPVHASSKQCAWPAS
jgi:hypothetical protein